jgi:hypothetical protein
MSMTRVATPRHLRRTPLLLASSLALLSATVASSARADDVVAQCITSSDKGIALRKQGKLVDARRSFAACAIAACGPEIKEACESRVTAINAAIPTVTFSPQDGRGRDLPGARVYVDGSTTAEDVDGRVLTLDPGPHALRFELAGQAMVTREFVLTEKVKDRREVIVFEPPRVDVAAPAAAGAPGLATATASDATPTPSKSSWGTQKTLAVVAGGVGVVGVVVGSVFGATASSDWSSAQKECKPGACGTGSAAETAKGDAQSAATVSTASFIAGGAFLAGGVLLFLTAPKHISESAPALTVAPTAGPGGGGLLMTGRF